MFADPLADISSDKGNAFLNIRLEIFLFSLLILLVFHIYAHSQEGPFVFDDMSNIVKNPFIRIDSLDWESLKKAAFESPSASRPVANISFALNYYCHKYDPRGFRLVNVIIHLCNGFLLYFFLKLTLQTPHLLQRHRNPPIFIPFAAVCIWLVNPLHTQSVSYIVQRMNSMATMFYLLAFLCYINFRLLKRGSHFRWPLVGAAVLSFLLALGSKEIAVTLPLFIFIYEWFFFRDLSLTWMKRNVVWVGVVLVIYTILIFLYLGDDPLSRILSSYHSRDFTLPQRTMTQFRVVIFYIFLFIFPHPARLNLDHQFPMSLSLLDPPTTLLSILAVSGLFVLAVATASRERLLSFAILWMLGNLVLESSVLGLEIVFEHRTYLPFILMSIVVVGTVHRLIKNKWIRGILFFMALATGTIWTHDRNVVWSDDITLWEDVMNKSPDKVRPYVNLGIAHKDRGQYEKSIHFLDKALHIDPDYTKAHYNLSVSLLSTGNFRKAEQYARKALRNEPTDVDTLNTLAIAQAQQGRLDEALEIFLQALRLNPHAADTHYNLGLTLDKGGQPIRAASHYAEALRIKPDYKAAHLQLQQTKRKMEFHKPARSLPFGNALTDPSGTKSNTGQDNGKQ